MTTLALWKPWGVLTKFTDAEGRPTLADHVDLPGVYPAGRLDMDSEGLLVLTDDPRLRGMLTGGRHPRTYLVQVERVPDEEALAALRQGVDVRGRRTLPAEVVLLPEAPVLPPRPVPIRHRVSVPDRWLRMTLVEGRNRQVRRMTAAVGHPTLRLVRWAIGPITLEGLEPGGWRRLDDEEDRRLREAIRPAGGGGSGRRRR
ncbi:MAG: pseudouridine synthase [Gemmatimonadetes bacterium]|nr:pseudouridine synthase [Gemmatimonadota bacterium]NIT89799.1 pseudouridine synthase [Gemmatimonadota bacterium]NIU33585.1 pseudouridine synthase [Gemmatimonadota bacterium]NIV63918.1 pseudouridine synthase [Gemmatimonadota bacterium]NIW66663.1 pseudouridine synthase [Gemmatimonadota bacterium]